MWVFHLTGSKRDVVPCVCRKERAGLRHTKRDEDAERGGRRYTVGDRLEAAWLPEVPEIRRDGLCIPADENRQEDERHENAGLRRREHVLNHLAVFEAFRVRPGEKRDQDYSNQLRSRQRNGVTR